MTGVARNLLKVLIKEAAAKKTLDSEALQKLLTIIGGLAAGGLITSAMIQTGIANAKAEAEGKRLFENQYMLYTNNTKAEPVKTAQDKSKLIDEILEKRAKLEEIDGLMLLQYKKELEGKDIGELTKIATELEYKLKARNITVGEVAATPDDGSDPLTALLLKYSF